MNVTLRGLPGTVAVLVSLCHLPSGAIAETVSATRSLAGQIQDTSGTALSALPPGTKRLLRGAAIRQSVVAADLNNDGTIDLAWVDFLANALVVALGDGAGDFRVTSVLPIGGGPRALTTADFNGDGAVDLALVTFLSGDLALLDGRGDGTFADARLRHLGQGLGSLISGDIDRDGRVDVITVNVLTGELFMLKGEGNGSLAAPSLLGRAAGASVLLKDDINKDGVADITAVNLSTGKPSIFVGRSAGGLREVDASGRLDQAVLFSLTDSASASDPSKPAERLLRLGGDGQAAVPGSLVDELLTVALRGPNATAPSGESVTFWRLSSSDSIERLGIYLTNEQGHAGMQVLLDGPPGTHRIVATMRQGDPAVFGAVSTKGFPEALDEVRQNVLQGAAAAASARTGSIMQVLTLLDAAEQFIAVDDAVSALRSLIRVLEDGGTAAPAFMTATVAQEGQDSAVKRLIDQILLGVVSVADVQPIMCDVPLAGSIDTPAEVDRLTFDGTAGERVHVTVAGITLTFPAWRLIGPGGIPVPGCDTVVTFERDCGLPGTGGYAIAIRDDLQNSTGTYSAHLQRLTAGFRCGGTATCNTPFSNTIEARADTDIFSFTAAAGERVHVTVAGAASTTLTFPAWRLINPAGFPVTGCNTFVTFERDCALPAAGSYAFEIRDDLLNSTGTYNAHVQRLTAGFRCGATATCNTPLSNTIETRADTDIFSFSAAAGERVHVTVAAITLRFPAWRLIGPSGAPVTGCNTFVTFERDCGLPTTGSYAIEIRDDLLNSTGTYSAHLQRLKAGFRCGGSAPCNTPFNNTIEARADTDIFSFSATAGERVHVTVAGATLTPLTFPAWRMINPAGFPVTGCNTFVTFERDCALPAAGSYAIEIRDDLLNSTGTYNAQMQRLTAGFRCGGTALCDVPFSNTIDTRADTDLFSFNAAAGERVHVTVSGTTLTFPAWRLIGPSGVPVTGCNTFVTFERDCALPVSGSYAIEIRDDLLNSTGTYSAHFQRLTAGFRCGGTAPCNVPVNGTIEARADTDIFSFRIDDAPTTVHAKTTGITLTFPAWRLINPAGFPVPGCDRFVTFERDCALPAVGSYAIEIRDDLLNSTGTYTFTVSGFCVTVTLHRPRPTPAFALTSVLRAALGPASESLFARAPHAAR
jgi:hypothetical protein